MKNNNTSSMTSKEKKWIKNEMEKLQNQNPFRLRETVEPHANFINVSKGYYNKGKYKGTLVTKSPVSYMEWLLNKSGIELNKGEKELLNKLINQ
jgi:uncharacterized protein (DUF3820 family)